MSILMSKLIKKTLFCVFILLILGLLVTCENPFVNNLGEKVVVEPPTISDIVPGNNSFLNKNPDGTVTITGEATAYIRIVRVEWKILANPLYNQPETEWSTEGITGNFGGKECSWYFTFDPAWFNNGRDGYITLQFRITDSATTRETIKYIFKIKNNPSEINMSMPSAKTIFTDEEESAASKVPWMGEISGQVVDVKGLKPGYPQIKIWPASFTDEPDDDDANWGWASLFLQDIEDDTGKIDNIDDGLKNASAPYLGSYADRSNRRVVNSARFVFRLAEFTIGKVYNIDGSPNMDLRPIQYTNFGGDFKYFESGSEYYFRIRTSDVEPDAANGEKPDLNSAIPPIVGYFPPRDFGIETVTLTDGKTAEVVKGDPLFPRADDWTNKDPLQPVNIQPVRIIIHASDVSPVIEFSNGDFKNKNGGVFSDNTLTAAKLALYTDPGFPDDDPAGIPGMTEKNNNILKESSNRPNPYITERTSYKIDVGDKNEISFRLRLLIIHPNGLNEAKLEWKHSKIGTVELAKYSDGVGGTNAWNEANGDWVDATGGSGGNPDKTQGQIFSYIAYGDTKKSGGSQRLFASDPEAYKLILTLTSAGSPKPDVYEYDVYLDGDNPKVSIRDVKGAYDPPSDKEGVSYTASLSSVNYPIGLVNKNAYTVNGNIQVALRDLTDSSGIMTWKAKPDGSGPDTRGGDPPEGVTPSQKDGYPMVKWVIEKENRMPPKDQLEPETGGTPETVLDKLITFKSDPYGRKLNAAGVAETTLDFFFDIDDEPGTPGVPPGTLNTSASGWVRKGFSDGEGFDQLRHFKINTENLDDGYYWLYVIAQDSVYNLGAAIQKIYIDQDSDKPTINTPPLVPETATFSDITGEGDETNLDVPVSAQGSAVAPTPNTGNNPRRNVLLSGDGIQLDLRDDDGIRLDKIKITLTVIDPVTDPDLKKDAASAVITTADLAADVFKVDPDTVARRWAAKLGQDVMAKALYDPSSGNTKLKNGIYKIEFEITDDPGSKVKIVRDSIGYPDGITPVLDGDTPVAVTVTKSYFFAVYNAPPDIEITAPDANEMVNEPVVMSGTAKSRLQVQSVWITFTPDIIKLEKDKDPALSSEPVEVTLTPKSVQPNSDGFYEYDWVYKGTGGTGVNFNPTDGSDDPYYNTQTVSYTVQAFDRLGYAGEKTRQVQIDSEEPELILQEFNHWRPADDDGKLYVYGKVGFTVSATDNYGLYKGKIGSSNAESSGIKWWVLPSTVAEPARNVIGWNLTPTTYTNTSLVPGTWKGGGEFPASFARDNRYTWVIDTRYLDDNTEYNFYIMARDRAGNYSYNDNLPIKSVLYATFIVDQSRDFPLIYPEDFSPRQDDVVDGVVSIMGKVSDLDLFNKENRNTYVRIRIPTNPGSSVPQWPAGDNDNWILITGMSDPYTTQNGGIDSAGDLVYKYEPEGSLATYFNDSQGYKYYQIRVDDEPVGPTDAQAATAKWYGKNPDLFMKDNPQYNDPVTGASYPYEYHDKVYKIYPSPTTGYRFIVDTTEPEIFFDSDDPTEGHPNYKKERPTFSSWELLKDALTGYVAEYKLSSLSMKWSAKPGTITKYILRNPAEDPPVAEEYRWNIYPKVTTTVPGPSNTSVPVGAYSTTDLTSTDDTVLKKFFEGAEQGLQIITFEAVDMVKKTSGPISYSFYKDTQGPEINFINISRSVKRKFYDTGTLRLPAVNDFPDGSASPNNRQGDEWPSDWPNGTTWKTVWSSFWQEIITNWPSEYAFKKAVEIIKALTLEDGRSPSAITGSAEEPPFIEGTFSDDYSPVMVSPPAPTYFYYRFHDKNGKPLEIPSGLEVSLPGTSTGGWLMEKMAAGQNELTADWKITLTKEKGFTGSDGENLLDIWVQDTAGNISYIYNVRFLVDSAPPQLGSYDGKTFYDRDYIVYQVFDKDNNEVTDPRIGKQIPKEEDRVFSGGYDSGSETAPAFIIKGRVNDYNLNKLTITIGQDGFTGYTVTATVTIDPLKSGAAPDGSGNGVTTTPADSVTGTPADSGDQYRLTLAGPYIAGTTTPYTPTSDGTPEWEWTLTVQKKDAYGLRTAAGANADSARRYIEVTATDKVDNKVAAKWYFYLDTQQPRIEYTNLDKKKTPGPEGTSFEGTVSLSGFVSDDTKIKDVQYNIGRWNYTTSLWNYYDTGTQSWSTTLPASWPSAFNASNPERQTSMNWTIGSDELAAGGYPDTLFKQEGKYRLDLIVTDFSLGSGNPHETYNPDDGFTDSGSPPSSPGAATMSGRVFFIDRDDPVLRWGWWDRNADGVTLDPVDEDPYNPDKQTYFRNSDETAYKDRVPFSFTAGDGNTLISWKATVYEGNEKLTTGTGAGTIVWESSGVWNSSTNSEVTTPNPLKAIPSPATSPANTPISLAKSTDPQKLVISPYMTQNAASGGAKLDADGKVKTYTITITVTDGASKTSSISKRFNLDNTPPAFKEESYLPLGYKRYTDNDPAASVPVSETPSRPTEDIPAGAERKYSYDTITGKLTIRGGAYDNSGQLKNISYYVVNKADTPGAWTSFPTAQWVTDNNKWRYYNGTGVNYPIIEIPGVSGSTLMEIDQGTFAWKIMVPQTSRFFTDTGADDYVQIARTGGTSIGGSDTWNAGTNTAGNYYDVDYDDIKGAGQTVAANQKSVPFLTDPNLSNEFNSGKPTVIYGDEKVGLITVYLRAEDAAGNVAYDILKYWIWPEGDRPKVTSIDNPSKDIYMNGTIRLGGMAKDNERVKNVWFRVLPLQEDAAGNITGIGAPYTNLKIPVWNTTNWEEATPKASQTPVNDDTYRSDYKGYLGARREDDPSSSQPSIGGGWYMANGGNSPEVSWWAYINTEGELNPTGDLFTYTPPGVGGTQQKGIFFLSTASNGNKQITFNPYKAPGADPPAETTSGVYTFTTTGSGAAATTTLTITGSTYSGAYTRSGIVTDLEGEWTATNGSKIKFKEPEEKRKFRVEVRAQDVTYNEKDDKWEDYVDATGGYRGFASTVKTVDAWVVADAPVFGIPKIAPVASFDGTNGTGSETTLWDTVEKLSIRGRSSFKVTVTHNIGLSAIRWTPTQWFVEKNSQGNPTTAGLFRADPSFNSFNLLGEGQIVNGTLYTPGSSYVYLNPAGNGYVVGTRAQAFTALNSANPAASTSMAVTVAAKGTPVSPGVYKEYEVFVDVRADLLMNAIWDPLTNTGADPYYGNGSAGREGQTLGSVYYPVYLSASDISKATPITSRGDSLLPIDQLAPTGMYTLNRKPAGSAATLGGTASDEGPVRGVARVVMWFQRDGAGVSWHELAVAGGLSAGTFTSYASASGNPNYIAEGPVWWKDVDLSKINGAIKPAIGVEANPTGGDSAIVIDTDSPSAGKPKWGHKLPMGFADSGTGKNWYVELNTYGITSGPIELHFVVIDKAGNFKYYKEKLVIMNNVAVIDRIKLATDIRGVAWAGSNLSGKGNARIDDSAALVSIQWPILNRIRQNIPFIGSNTNINDDVKKGISDWIGTGAMGAGKIIDFNVRNRVFALRLETLKPPGLNKTRNFRLEYVSSARRMTSGTPTGNEGRLTDIKAGRVYIIDDPGTATWGALGAEGDSWKSGDAFIAIINGTEPDETDAPIPKISGTGTAWELNYNYPAIRETANSTEMDAIPAALRLTDVNYTISEQANALSAEFVYANDAFGNANAAKNPAGNTIVDTVLNATNPVDAAWPAAANANPVSGKNYSLFILRVFDGSEEHIFGDFKIIRVRVNNDDETAPFAQLYDINPKTEGQERQNIAKTGTTDDLIKEQRRNLAPLIIGEGAGSNRTRGGLWNISATANLVEKPGHIEPMQRTYNTPPYTNQITLTTGSSPVTAAQQHSLTSAQMGGAASPSQASLQKPMADPRGFLSGTVNNITQRDTVSGKVALRGYAEDDQRIQSVTLSINDGTAFNILEFNSGDDGVEDTQANRDNYDSPRTGLLQIPTGLRGSAAVAPQVYYTDSIDLYRHRVEWVYIWDTETTPGGANVTGNNINVTVRSYNRNPANNLAKTGSAIVPSGAAANAHTGATEAGRPNSSPFNPGFPVGMHKYNSISFNIRPYITGFLRNKDLFSHDTRSRQGRYMFYRGEIAVVTGFNLGTTANNGSINIPGMDSVNATVVDSPGAFGIDTNETRLPVATRNMHYRQFTVNATTATTGSGLVTYTFNQPAFNTGSERLQNTDPQRPRYIQPWNIEYSRGKDGSQLWDDFTQVHIWQSNDTASGGDNGRFPKGGNTMEVFDPSMSIDPKTGTLWSSHNEGGGNGSNTGTTKISNNSAATSVLVAAFIDPIINSDIFISTRQSGPNGANFAYSVWSAYSIIGKQGGGTAWTTFGGIYMSGPQGGNAGLSSGQATANNNGFNGNDFAARSQYLAESTWYNSSDRIENNTPALNQFKNPHIVTYAPDTSTEHIHVSYYDTKDQSIKYRYNRRGTPDTVNGNGAPRAWTNLDGGVDDEDQTALVAVSGAWTAVGVNNRILNWTNNLVQTRTARATAAGELLPDAGEYNSIAITSQGYPVIAYYDMANQKLRIAISSNTVPIAASNWSVQDVLPSKEGLNFKGTGEYVSMKIDTTKTPNIVHIAAMKDKNLVYITGTLTIVPNTGNPAASTRQFNFSKAQVVDSVGSVGRWCSLSLDRDGNPWISYQDESYQDARDGVKLAYYSGATGTNYPRTYYKGSDTYRPGEDTDMYGTDITGWEAMHVPTAFRVENARMGMENFPACNVAPNANTTKFWLGAVGYLGQDYFRIAYYVK